MSLTIGRVLDIPIRLHVTVFIILLLITWTVGFGLMPGEYPGLNQTVYLLIGVFSSILLFASILLHELAHSIVAKRNGLKINQISLFIFGGIAEMSQEPKDPSLELKMAVAGPLTSIAIMLVAGALWLASISLQAHPLIQAPLEYTALINGIVALFNLAPAFPLDGGRIFRSIIWKRRKDLLSATQTASKAGAVFAYALMFLGIFTIFSYNFISGLWLLLIGWFILGGARSGLEQTIVKEALGELKVRDIMTKAVDSVRPDSTVEKLAEDFLRLKHNGFPVMSDGELEGIVTAEDLRKVGRELWSTARVKDIMTPKEKLIAIKPEQAALDAMILMAQKQIGRILVVEEGKLVGIVTRSDVMKTVRIRTGIELGSAR